MDELEKAKEIFLGEDVDDETRADNLALIVEWERDLFRNQAYDEWKKHDITREINKMVKESYLDAALTLSQNRSLTPEERSNLYAKQDACLFILNLTDQDAKSALESLLREIRQKLNAI